MAERFDEFPKAGKSGSWTDYPAVPLKIVGDVIRSVAGGMSFDLADEFAAFMSTLTGFGGITEGGTYEEELTAQRARDKAISPAVKIPGEIGGAIVTTIAAAPLTAPLRAAKVMQKVPGWLKATGFGSFMGGAFGFGASEGGLKERAKGAALGAGLGGVTAGPLYGMGKGIQYGVGKLGTAIRTRVSPTRTAKAKIVEAVGRDEMTQGRLRQRLLDLGPQATLADAGGRNIRGLARTTASSPGPAQNRAEIMLAQRAEDDVKSKKDTDDALHELYGVDFRRNINDLNAWIGTAGEEVKAKIFSARMPDGTPLGNDPDFLKWMIGQMRAINPLVTVPGLGEGDPLAALDDEIAAIENTIQNDNKGYQKDKKMQARYLELLSARNKRK